jgi:membrane associated rhomboid family serine protease
MIPLSDRFPSRQPLVIWGIIGINLALFMAEINLELKGTLGEFLTTWGIVPARIHAIATDAMNSNNPANWLALIILPLGSIFLSLFLHSSFSQILGNLLFLWVFGKSLEEILGHGRFLIFYILSGLLTGVGQVLIEPTLTTPLVGSNGAIAAILGAYLLSFPKAKIESILPLVIVFIPVEIPAFFYLLWWFVQQIFYGVGQLETLVIINQFSLAYWTHGLGLLIGAGLIPLLVKNKPVTAIY